MDKTGEEQTNNLNKRGRGNGLKWWNLWGKEGREKQPAATVSSASKQALIIFFIYCSQKYCVAMNIIILPRISIYCCNAMQQRYKQSVINAFLRVRLIFLVHCSHTSEFVSIEMWLGDALLQGTTWEFTSQFPEVESNKLKKKKTEKRWFLSIADGLVRH